MSQERKRDMKRKRVRKDTYIVTCSFHTIYKLAWSHIRAQTVYESGYPVEWTAKSKSIEC
jgi:hypothetical protein